MNYILETERLRLREFTIDDTGFIIRLLNSPGWLQYIGNKNVHTQEQAQQYLLNGPIKSYKENGFGLSMVERKSDNSALGMCGLIKRDFLESPDIGFAFLPEHNGQGYALEIAYATLQLAKNKLEVKSTLAIVMRENEKSKRLLEKLGLTYSRLIHFPGETEELLLYTTDYKGN